MEHFYIVTNRSKDPTLKVTKSIADYLTEHGKTCAMRDDPSDPDEIRVFQDYRYTDPKGVPDDTDCLIVLGGDGTLIQAARDVVERQIPILGINLGTLGYLAEIDRANIFPALDKLMNEEYQLERRMMLEGHVFHQGKMVDSDIALNDIVIGREGQMHIISLKNYVNGAYLNSYRADGMIVATPTGSTGYSLSAGGPLISPSASLFLLTPIAAHTLNTRSVILPPENEITVVIGEGRDGTVEHAVVCFDGDAQVAMVTGDRVVITRSERDAVIVKIHNDSFLETLSRKMS